MAAVPAGAYAWWAAVRPPFSVSAHVAVFVPAVLILAAGLALRRRRSNFGGSRLLLEDQHPKFEPVRDAPFEGPALVTSGLVLWGALVLAVVGWELFNWVQQPREDHPTMSSLINEVDTMAVRRFLFFGWLALGWLLVRR